MSLLPRTLELLEGEIFLPVTIAGYENRYKVSNCGRVKRMAYTQKNPLNENFECVHPELIIKPSYDRYGYSTVILHRGGRKNPVNKTMTVHRLVALAFLENPECKPAINHRDFNRTNNHVSNLEWVTNKENSSHTVKFGRQIQGDRVHTNKLAADDVRKILEIADKYPQKKIALMFGVTQANVRSILLGETWKSIVRTKKKIKGKQYRSSVYYE